MSKAANDNGSRRIMYRREGMGPGLKILVSAVQSRPCPPVFSGSCLSRNSPPDVRLVSVHFKPLPPRKDDILERLLSPRLTPGPFTEANAGA